MTSHERLSASQGETRQDSEQVWSVDKQNSEVFEKETKLGPWGQQANTGVQSWYSKDMLSNMTCKQ